MFWPSPHAAQRYVERFAGNLTPTSAASRLQRVARRARFRRTLPGGARLYATGDLNLVVQRGTILTVYRLTYRTSSTEESLKCPDILMDS